MLGDMEATSRRILVPTDFSETANTAIGAAIDLAKALSAEIVVAHVQETVMVLPPPLELVSIPATFPDLARRVEEALEAAATRVRSAGIGCEVARLEGHAHVEIVRHAQEIGAEYIVMGTHGRSGLAHAILGSVTERVIHQAPCPVLVVPFRKR